MSGISNNTLNVTKIVTQSLEVNEQSITCINTNESNTSDPRIDAYNNEVSPTNNDSLGALRWYGNNDAGTKTLFAKISGISADIENNAGRGEMRLNILNNDGAGSESTSTIGLKLRGTDNSLADAFINSALECGDDGTRQGTLKLWDGAGGNTPGYLVLYSPNGTANYIFCEDDGTLKRHTSIPTANGDGSEIGGQS